MNACHDRDLGVVLDVVYNHIGPSGAYLYRFGPYFAGSNQWGAALNVDGPGSDEVRRYVIDNAVSWLRDFHVDGLRLDAVHAIEDHRALPLLEELAAEVDALAAGLQPAAQPDRRIRSQRPEADHVARGQRVRAHRPVVR